MPLLLYMHMCTAGVLLTWENSLIDLTFEWQIRNGSNRCSKNREVLGDPWSLDIVCHLSCTLWGRFIIKVEVLQFLLLNLPHVWTFETAWQTKPLTTLRIQQLADNNVILVCTPSAFVFTLLQQVVLLFSMTECHPPPHHSDLPLQTIFTMAQQFLDT